VARLKDVYRSQIAPALQERFKYHSPMAVPRVEKVVVSMGIGKATQDKKFLDAAMKDIAMITGQKPLVCKAKKSVSNFKLRQGNPIGLKVTLRKDRMYEFIDRLVNLVIPRVRDFRGLNPHSFDGLGNYSMGLSEQGVFPEINLGQIQFTQGLNITFVTTAKSDDESREMLRLFGMPFREM
jgi:large subunit ribosomal protein L5